MFQLLAAVGNRAKPSWCFEVITMYFMPASLASAAHASGSYFTGLKSLAIGPVVGATGILPWFMIHSPMPPICLPS